MVAASTVAIMGGIGGGVDFARGYMAQARLAQACDAAVLAGRKLLRDADTRTDGSVIAGSPTDKEIQNFIDYNYAEGQFGSAPITRTSSLSEEGELRLTLATTLPTTLLPIVGIDSLNINADCASRRSGVNVDVVLVLDVTESMLSSIGSTTRIKALREASSNFVDILDELAKQLEPSGLRVRIGVVPYSSTVNVGKDLYAEDPNYIQLTGDKYYAFMNTICLASAANNFCGTGKSSNNGKYIQSANPGTWNGVKNTGETGTVTLDTTDYVRKGLTEPDNAYGWGGCVEARPTVQTITGSETSFSSIPAGAWDIKDVAPGVGGAPRYQPYLNLPEYNPHPGFPAYNNEYGPPSSSQSTDAIWQMVGPHALDKVPYRIVSGQTTLTSFFPTVSNSSYVSNGPAQHGPNYFCQKRVKLLDEYDPDDLKDYFNELVPYGWTFHDIGMYWGLALISPEAPFPNPDTYIKAGSPGVAQPVKRYIVFMSDGDLEIDPDIYSAWGHESRPSTYRNNVSPNRTNDPGPRHRVRFRMLCEAAKQKGIEISTVAFSTGIGSEDRASLQGCATSPDQYYQADSADQLNKAFEKIAKNIGFLRVSK